MAAACGVWALLSSVGGRVPMPAIVGFGTGLSLMLDEWVYLIVTDGSNQSYLRPVSLLSGLASVGMMCVFTVLVSNRLSNPRPKRK